MPYPMRPRREPLPQFVGTHGRPPELRSYVASEYAAGRSLRELAELTDRSWSEIRNLLAAAGVRRREAGAPPSPRITPPQHLSKGT